jgi:uncharacterized protein YbjT (DUF2867 family)
MSGTILVVGGGGRNGRAVVRLLGQADAKVRVAGRRPGLIGGKPGGTGPAGGETVDTVWFDWEEPGSYQGALDGASQVYLIAPEGLRGLPGYVRRFMEQAAAAGAEHVVALSAMGVEDRDDLPLRQAELAVMALAPAWTILRPNWFMQNFSSGLFRRGIAERDEIAAPGGDGAISFIDVEDIAASAAAVLTQPWAGNRAHVLTGARALRLDEAADVLSEVAGRVIRYQPLDPDDARSRSRRCSAGSGRVKRQGLPVTWPRWSGGSRGPSRRSPAATSPTGSPFANPAPDAVGVSGAAEGQWR